MALINCRECSKEFSSEAKTCPHCGASRKRSHGLGTIALFAIVALVAIVLYGKNRDTATSVPGTIASAKAETLAKTKIKSFRWWREGFDTILMADLVVENKGRHGVRDFEVRCSGYAPSGTRIDGNKQVIYETVPAGKTKSFKKVNMGFLHGQVEKVGCYVTDIVVVPDMDVLAAEAGLK